jgi:NADH:ubiquinone oxidoreductase subunit K
MASHEEDSSEKPPRIRRGRIDSFALFEVTEQELDILEKGSPNALQLNFSIALLSAAISFLISLMTQDLHGKTYTVFVVVTSVGSIVGVYLMLVWARHRASVSETVKRIRGRLPSDRGPGEQAG